LLSPYAFLYSLRGRLEVEPLRLEIAGPFAQLLVFRAAGIRQDFQQIGIAPRPAAVLRRTGPLAGQKTRSQAIVRQPLLDGDFVPPVIAEVVPVSKFAAVSQDIAQPGLLFRTQPRHGTRPKWVRSGISDAY